MIRPIEPRDYDAAAAIYNHYVLHTAVTFDETPVSAAEMGGRVAEDAGKVVGWAYASKWKGRCAYRFSCESSVYLAPDAVGKGWGTKLYEALFARLREKKVHAVIGGISLPNPASVALHEKFGMKKVAEFPEVGFEFGSWVAVGYWQALLPVEPYLLRRRPHGRSKTERAAGQRLPGDARHVLEVGARGLVA